jgi:P-type Cu2+ transporter
MRRDATIASKTPELAAGTHVAPDTAVTSPVGLSIGLGGANVALAATCPHCGQTLIDDESGPFCCPGCASVYTLLRTEHLDKFYELRGPLGRPVFQVKKRRDDKWLEPVAHRLAATPGLTCIELDVQGLHCAACVWLIEQLFRRENDRGSIVINPALGRLLLTVSSTFPLRDFVEHLESVGYLVGPKAKSDQSSARGLLLRLGVCASLSMNAMIFSIAIYAGLASGPLRRLFDALDFGLATAVVVVGGSLFLRAALSALRLRAVHLDLPIAIGIASAYVGSVYALYVGRAPYFDSLCVFTTLMILGRFLQQRVLEKNQRQLLSAAGSRSLLTRRREGDAVCVVPCPDIEQGDCLVIAPGDLVPVEATVTKSRCDFSLDWINGESAPRSIAMGEMVPAGSFNAGSEPIDVRANTSFAESPVTKILETPCRGRSAQASRTNLRWLPSAYVVTVLSLGVVAFFFWLHRSHDVSHALSALTAMLVVTCPCAFGIATPLAYELTLAKLRARGLFVRSDDFLDKVSRVKRIVLDKTGTLTDGSLDLVDTTPLVSLTQEELSTLHTLATASSHPKSEAIRRHLSGAPAVVHPVVVEGRGVEAVHPSGVYRLGAPSWAAPSRARPAREPADVVFSRDGIQLAGFRTTEKLRSDARREVSELQRQGYELWILSGDQSPRVANVARAVGVESSRAVGNCSPGDKEAWIKAHDQDDTLMVGDGINDLAAVATAFCSGTPAIDRPFVASRADFYFVSPGIGPIRAALRAGRALDRVVRRNLWVAVTYNAAAVTLVIAGIMSPLICAVLMPLSSLSTLLTTTASLSEGRLPWKS